MAMTVKSKCKMIDRANEFYSVKNMLKDYAHNGRELRGKTIRTIEDYLTVVDDLWHDPDRDMKAAISMMEFCYPRHTTKRGLVLYVELYCIYAGYPRETAVKILEMKKQVGA